MFSNLEAISISLATVTPSLVTIGAPNARSMSTLRPFGPSVTFTASASVLTPFKILALAFWRKTISLADMEVPLSSLAGSEDRPRPTRVKGFVACAGLFERLEVAAHGRGQREPRGARMVGTCRQVREAQGLRIALPPRELPRRGFRTRPNPARKTP